MMGPRRGRNARQASGRETRGVRVESETKKRADNLEAAKVLIITR
jgi:hypothetical protein